ncbi:MAG: AAA family ATPase [Ignavibacteria bacterium]|nr:AAA family ATPase [Ignavibacteria bacterium]
MDSIKPYLKKDGENNYCLPDSGANFKNNFFIISGCSGSGKSSILQEISNRGYKVIPETGRQVVKEQILIKGDALPWKDWMKFVELTVSRTMYQYNILNDEKELVFFDRSIIDQISWEHLNLKVPKHLINAANEYRFNENVFITEPWKEIYKNDSERKHSYEDAVISYQSTIKTYSKFGYKTIFIPPKNIAERADFIIELSQKFLNN